MNGKSPSLTEMVTKRRVDICRARNSLKWAALNLLVSTLIVADIYHGIISFNSASKFINSMLRYFEIFLGLLFATNAIYDLILYAWPYFWMKPIEVKESEKKLLGIRDGESGFILYTPKAPSKDAKAKPKMLPNSSFSLTPELSFTSNHMSTPKNTSNPFYTSTPNSSMIGNASSRNYSLTSSWQYQGENSMRQSAQSSLHNSVVENASLRKRASARISLDNSIKDESSLQDYLSSYEEVEDKLQQMQDTEDQRQQQGSFSFQEQSCVDSRVLNYQPASDAAITTFVDQNLMSSQMKSVDMLCQRLKIKEGKLNQWVENIRSWISQTILAKLVKDIEAVNQSLSRIGLSNSLIGEIGISALKQLASLKVVEIPTLAKVLPYLEFTSNQEYLIQRLKDLGKGGCMADFVWNKGTMYKGKQWTEEWPTDSLIVIHAFCTYMDSRLPSNPSHPNGKTFTGQYFKTNKEQSTEKKSFYILQHKLNPPHYKVVVEGGVVCEVPGGRNNTFYALAVFFHHVKSDHFGLLGRVNLGFSGVNVLWTIDV